MNLYGACPQCGARPKTDATRALAFECESYFKDAQFRRTEQCRRREVEIRIRKGGRRQKSRREK